DGAADASRSAGHDRNAAVEAEFVHLLWNVAGRVNDSRTRESRSSARGPNREAVRRAAASDRVDQERLARDRLRSTAGGYGAFGRSEERRVGKGGRCGGRR